MNLLPMDYALLRHLVEFDGAVPSISIPSKLFAGEIPDGTPNLIECGVIEHRGDLVAITPAGRLALSSHQSNTEAG